MSPQIPAKSLEELFSEKRFADMAQNLSAAKLQDLAAIWLELRPMAKLAAFKLLSADRALELYLRLPFPERYFIFCGFHPSAVAPILEGLPAPQRKLFTELPRWYYEKMLENLLREAASPALPLKANGALR